MIAQKVDLYFKMTVNGNVTNENMTIFKDFAIWGELSFHNDKVSDFEDEVVNGKCNHAITVILHLI